MNNVEIAEQRIEEMQMVRTAMADLKAMMTGRDPYVEEGIVSIICSNIARKLLKVLSAEQVNDDSYLSRKCATIAANIGNMGMLGMSINKIAYILYNQVKDIERFINMRPVQPGCMCAQGFGSGLAIPEEVFKAIAANNELMANVDRKIKLILSNPEFIASNLEIKI